MDPKSLAIYQLEGLCGSMDSFLAPSGFRRKGATWRFSTEETILIFNVQMCGMADEFYFNVGVYFRLMGNAITPMEWDCHFRDRIPNDQIHSPVAVARVMKLATPFLHGTIHAKECTELAEIICPLAIHWCHRFHTIETSKAALRNDPPPFGADPEVWSFLGIPVNEDCCPF